jgi:hypothetical protein
MQREIIPCPKAVAELAKDSWGAKCNLGVLGGRQIQRNF